MIERLIVVPHGRRQSAPSERGGVELEDDAMIGAAGNLGIHAQVVAPDDLPRIRVGAETIIYVQRAGRLGPHHASHFSAANARGAWVFEKNVFALASRWRPQHPRYITIVMSKDGWERFSYRSLAARANASRKVMILGNPQFMRLSARDGGAAGRIRLLRVGRPDRIKWSNFELKFAAAAARVRPAVEFELTRVGVPDGLQPLADLPPNLHVDDRPYQSDVSSLYSTADAYIHHSRIGETFGNTVAEARAVGLPVILGTNLRWDCAAVELLDDACAYGSPSQLLAHPQAVLTRALSTPARHWTSNTPEAYLSTMLAATQGEGSFQTSGSGIGMHRHLRSLKDGSQWMKDQSPLGAMFVEALRAARDRRASDE